MSMLTAGTSPIDPETLTAPMAVAGPITARELEIDLKEFRQRTEAGTSWENFLDFLAMGQRG